MAKNLEFLLNDFENPFGFLAHTKQALLSKKEPLFSFSLVQREHTEANGILNINRVSAKAEC
jgi:hypothetical protein